MSRRLYRSTEHKIIGGVCGGMGEHFDIDPTWLRIAFVILTITKGIGLLLYLICWVIIPKQSPEDAAEAATASPAKSTRSGFNTSLLPGIILIGLGVMFLLYESFWWFDFDFVWPVILIVVGGALIYRHIDAKKEPEQEQEAINESR